MDDTQTVVAQNLDFGTSSDDIEQHFSKAGHVKNVQLVCDNNGASKGMAFITFQTPEEAQNAIQYLHNSDLQGKKVFVEQKKANIKSNKIKTKKDSMYRDEIIKRLNSIEDYLFRSNLNGYSPSKQNIPRIQHSPFNEKPNFGNSILDLDEPANDLDRNEIIKSSDFQNSPNDDYDSDDFDSVSNDDDYDDDYDDEYSFSSFTQKESYQSKLFNDTSNILKRGTYKDSNGTYIDIRKKVAYSNKNTIVIDKDMKFDSYLKNKFRNRNKWGRKEKSAIYSKIEITDEGTFEAAKRIKSFGIKEVCALCSASPVNPGGGGSKNNKIGQEETLVRQSSLYSSLIRGKKMYNYNKKNKSPFNSHYMIYSPNVVVIRDEDYDLIYPFRVSIISTSAVNNSELAKLDPFGTKGGNVYRCMKNRCRKILELAIAMDNKAIVLGAFGCGVFGNRPDDVSSIFKELLVDEFYGLFFKKIIFAIKGKPGQRNLNLEAFNSAFHSHH